MNCSGGVKLSATSFALTRINIHRTSAVKYPEVKQLKLPVNVESVTAGEIGQFSPLRTRDITGPAILSHRSLLDGMPRESFQIRNARDPHVDSYDCNGSVSLNSSMQTNVPAPFNSNGISNYLNMPGGSWSRSSKFIADDMQNVLFSSLKDGKKGMPYYYTGCSGMSESRRNISSQAEKPTSKREMLKKAVKDYGSTVVVFHVGISLISLGGFYLLVSSGIDVAALLDKWNIGGGAMSSGLARGAGTFITAYAVHKIFAPVRISITLACTPFLVRYLRRVGVLKNTPSQQKAP